MKDRTHSLIEPALDRWTECHWYLHQMEEHYHFPDPFRYSLNSFIRAFKEVPQILKMVTQQDRELQRFAAPMMSSLAQSDLYKQLVEKRNFLVHRGKLELHSRGNAGTIEGNRVKISFPFTVPPWESSDDAYVRYKEVCRADKMMRGVIGPDCDSAPVIWRTWMIKEFPGRDLLEIAFEAWAKLGEVLSEVLVQREQPPLDLTMTCRHDPEQVKVKRFSQRDFFLDVDGIDLDEEERKWRDERDRRAREIAQL